MIDWKRLARAIHDQVRAANPRTGGAGTCLRGHPVHVHQVTPVKGDDAAPGTIVRMTMDELRVAAGTQALRLDVVGTEDGVFTGNRFAAALGLRAGNFCGMPSVPSMSTPH